MCGGPPNWGISSRWCVETSMSSAPLPLTLLDLSWHCAKTASTSTGSQNELILTLFAPDSDYEKAIQSMIQAGESICAQEAASGASVDITGAASCGSTPPSAPNTFTGPICGRSCWSSANLCSGRDGCRCIAGSHQGVGSRFFSRLCKPALGTNTTQVANGSVPADTSSATVTLAVCPCNCTYVSEACYESLTGIVHEPAVMNLGELEPPVSSCCNTTTGGIQQGRRKNGMKC